MLNRVDLDYDMEVDVPFAPIGGAALLSRDAMMLYMIEN